MSTPKYRLTVFGGLAIAAAGESTAPLGNHRKKLAFLAALAVGGDRGVSRDRLLAWLWPESDTVRARNSLNQFAHSIRRDLGDDSVVGAGGDLRINAAVIGSDIADFRAALKNGDHDTAASIYRGAFLDGVFLRDAPDFELWVADTRGVFADEYARALEAGLERAVERDQPHDAVGWASRLAQHDPLSTRNAVRLMNALERSGDTPAAIRHAEIHALRVRTELDTAPDGALDREVARLRAAVFRGAVTPSPPVGASAPTPPAEQANGEQSPAMPRRTWLLGSGVAHPSVAPRDVSHPGVLQAPANRSAQRTQHAIAWSMGALVALATLWLMTPWLGLGRSLIDRGKVNSGDALLVADFKTTGPDSGIGSALTGGMRESLRESRVVTLASAPAIGAGLERMRRSRASTLDAATAVELAQRIGVKAVVTGSVTPLRSGYLVTAELIAASSGDELAAFQESAGASDSLIPAVDRLARRLRVSIGESLKSISADPPLAQVTTASLNALRKFTEANQANAIEGDYPKAVRLLKEAVALDSTFGSAYRDLAVTTLNSGVHDEEAPEFEEKAYQLRDRMTERERLVTVASYYASGGPHPDARKSLDALKVVVDRYPEMGSFLNQGIAYRVVRDFAREDSAYRRAIAASGGVVGGAFKYFNLVRAELNLGHISGAHEALRVATARFPGDARIEQEKTNIAYAEGNADSARAACQRALAARLTQARLEANKCLANLALREGRVALARRYHRTADALGDSLGQPADSVGDLLWAAEVNARVYQRPDATLRILKGATSALLKAEMEPRGGRPQATRSSSTAVYIPPPLLRAAALFAMAGSADRAAALLGQYDREPIDTVSRRLEDAARHEVLGWIDLSRSHPLSAAADFRRADTVSGAPASACRICIDLNLAEAFQRANLLDSAIAALEHYVNTPDAYRLQHDAIEMAPTLRRLGALYAAKGDRARAAAYDRRFVELWKNADPDLQPQVIETRRFVDELSRMEHPASGNRAPWPPQANRR